MEKYREFEKQLNLKEILLNLPDKDVDKYVFELLKKTNSYKKDEEIYDTIQKIDVTIGSINSNYKSLKEFKKEGGTNEKWLLNFIEKIPAISKFDIINVIKDSINKANENINSEIFEIEQTKDKTVEITKINEDIEINPSLKKIKDEFQNNVLLNLIINEYDNNKKSNENIELNSVKQFFENNESNNIDKSFTKVLTVALEIAKNKKFKPLQNFTTEEIALLVDKTLNNLKQAHKVSKGEANSIDVVEDLIDRTFAQAKVIIENTAKIAGTRAGEAIGNAIGAYFGPIGVTIGGFIGRAIGSFVGNFIGKFVNDGLKRLADFAKKQIKNVSNFIVNKLNVFSQKLFS